MTTTRGLPTLSLYLPSAPPYKGGEGMVNE